MTYKKNIFIEKLSNEVKNQSGIPGEIDEIILDLIGQQEVSRKEIIEIYEQEKSNKNSKLNKETIECLNEFAHGTFWNDKWNNDFEEFA
jgi:hypothetical protein